MQASCSAFVPSNSEEDEEEEPKSSKVPQSQPTMCSHLHFWEQQTLEDRPPREEESSHGTVRVSSGHPENQSRDDEKPSHTLTSSTELLFVLAELFTTLQMEPGSCVRQAGVLPLNHTASLSVIFEHSPCIQAWWLRPVKPTLSEWSHRDQEFKIIS